MEECMHACFHVCMYICRQTCMSVHLYQSGISPCMYVARHATVYMYMCLHLHMYVFMDTHIHDYVCKYTDLCMSASIHKCHIHAAMYVCIFMQKCVWMYVCRHACVHDCIYIYIYIHVVRHTWVCMTTHVCMYICACICTKSLLPCHYTYLMLLNKIWMQHCKYEPHSHYALRTYGSNIFAYVCHTAYKCSTILLL